MRTSSAPRVWTLRCRRSGFETRTVIEFLLVGVVFFFLFSTFVCVVAVPVSDSTFSSPSFGCFVCAVFVAVFVTRFGQRVPPHFAAHAVPLFSPSRFVAKCFSNGLFCHMYCAVLCLTTNRLRLCSFTRFRFWNGVHPLA